MWFTVWGMRVDRKIWMLPMKTRVYFVSVGIKKSCILHCGATVKVSSIDLSIIVRVTEMMDKNILVMCIMIRLTIKYVI